MDWKCYVNSIRPRKLRPSFFAADRIHQISENYYTLCVVGGELEKVPLLMQIILTPA